MAGKSIRVTLGLEELASLDRIRSVSGYSRSAQIEGLILAAANEDPQQSTKRLAVTELRARVARYEIHLARALEHLANASPGERYRRPMRGSCERADARYARKVVSHSRTLAKARALLAVAGAA